MAFRIWSQRSILVLFILTLLSACSTVPLQSPPQPVGHKESGKASFYAMKFQSRKTASGERFDQSAKTAAHRSLPFGTKVKVTNVKNGQSVVVKINDRGPFVRGRVIDLSQSAFNCIGNTHSGVINVDIEVIE